MVNIGPLKNQNSGKKRLFLLSPLLLWGSCWGLSVVLSGCTPDKRFPSLNSRPIEHEALPTRIIENKPLPTAILPPDANFDNRVEKILTTAETAHQDFEKQAQKLRGQIEKLRVSLCKQDSVSCLVAKSQNENWIIAEQNLTSLASSGRDPLLSAINTLEEARAALIQHKPPINPQKLNQVSDRLQELDNAEKETITRLGQQLHNY
ncbi:MAG: hypothetical protein ABF461_03190 [Zymomonas mobilis subsp. pomaceae]|uniref:Uncharacterized protein n=1 Tax=Zymomonas mobilis subsp. pomaceae (strain ATCC 29192 / DSM 22645 / JCM 10191 / CCUG 17912 / NBRC 13757 / NCIMB 11200 / NRRL B-4491 / Barker I) TaxID=579138 RepID=F8EUB2_ZYMMT|nr:hypothetical protein [Zymomonas mobilis]AEI38133.1 hypothetical protein Zymop_1239 [Zymomonas mobilis subsp. pomaceae ATCC 29192]MDX5949500.1 hypothetical protein [Zymomonas mobilis subsp. pomaceae]GEB89243.1 hypothetical protein ZMO02_08800 [Zymomonas mobilis subsp. pomaceae]